MSRCGFRSVKSPILRATSFPQIATDFGVLNTLITKLWPDASRRPVLVGPDPHSYHGVDPKVTWISDFLLSCLEQKIPIFAATHHEYSEVDSTTFTSPATLDTTGLIARMVNKTVRNANPSVQVWAGEIGPHNGGSPPCDHTSMRWAVRLLVMLIHAHSGLANETAGDIAELW